MLGKTTEFAVDNAGTTQRAAAENADPAQTAASITNKTTYIVKRKKT